MKSGEEYLKSTTKRRLDIIGAAGLGACLAPLELVGLITAWADNGFINPLYSSVRVDGQGQEFEITKLRTMPAGSDATDASFGTYDPRSSAIAKLMRAKGIDESPQIRNVLQGTMSLLGVRAYSQAGLDKLARVQPDIYDEWHEKAYRVGRPALISVSHLYKRGFQTWTPAILEHGMQLDIEYVQEASLVNDIKILGSLPLKLGAPSSQEA